MAKADKEVAEVTLFTKEQLRDCKEFEHRKDLVMALIKDEEQISKEELRKRIKEFLERGSK